MPLGGLAAVSGDTALYGGYGYTIAFDTMGGQTAEALSKRVADGGLYGRLPAPTKEGYDLAGWFTEAGGKGEMVSKKSVVRLTCGQTLYASWTAEVPSEYVEIVLDVAGMAQDEVEAVVKRHTNASFETKIFEVDESGEETRIIIAFKNTEDARMFVRSVNGYVRDNPNSFIRGAKCVEAVGSDDVSFSPAIFQWHCLALTVTAAALLL